MNNLLEKSQDSLKNKQLFAGLYGFPRNQFSAVKWVLSTSSLSGVDRLIAATFASFYNTGLGYVYPNQKHVADICKVSERTVNTAVQKMKMSGEWLIIPVKLSKYDNSVSNRYYLLPPAGYGLVSQWISENVKMPAIKNQKSSIPDKNESSNRTYKAQQLKLNIKSMQTGTLEFLTQQLLGFNEAWWDGSIPNLKDNKMSSSVEILNGRYANIPPFISFEKEPSIITKTATEEELSASREDATEKEPSASNEDATEEEPSVRSKTTAEKNTKIFNKSKYNAFVRAFLTES